MEQCLLKGQELGVAQFPVLDGERVVGVISANEIFQLAAHCLGAWERRSGLTLAPLRLGPGVLGRIADVAEAAGAVLQALYPIGHHDGHAEAGHAESKVVDAAAHATTCPAWCARSKPPALPVLESTEPRACGAGHLKRSDPLHAQAAQRRDCRWSWPSPAPPG